MKKLITSIGIITAAYVLLLPVYLPAQTFVINGSAVDQGNDCFLLTPALTTQAGSVWSQNKIDLSFDFEIQATLNLGANDGGADGIAFVLQPLCTGLGSSGGGLGYQGINPSVAVEYDTWINSENNDPFQDHMSIQQNGSTVHLAPSMLAGLALLPNIENNADHTTVITWNAALQSLSVLFDGMVVLQYTGDIVADIFGGNPQVFWGFTAATGAAVNNQSVCINGVTATESIPYAVTDASCPNASDGAIDFSAGPGFTFLWNTGATTEDLTGVPAGTYTLSVIDAGGCASDYTIEVGFVPDITPPEARCRDFAVLLDDTGAATITTADVDDGSSDDCIFVSLGLDVTAFDCADIGAQTATLTVTDGSGNTASCASVVNVKDELAPTVTCPELITVCGADIHPDQTGSATATDNCSVATIEYFDNASNLTCADELTLVRTWQSTDQSGNIASCFQLINLVKDTEGPECLNCPGDLTLACDEAIPDLPLLEVTDDCDPNPAIALISTTTQTGDGSCTDFSYTIARAVIVTDRCGNTRSYPQTITVKDDIAPVLNCPAPANITCGGDISPAATGTATATDNCTASPALSFVDAVTSGDCNFACDIVRTWQAADVCGNTSTCEQVITSSTLDLFETALSMDVNGDGVADGLVMGGWQHSLTLGADVAQCIPQWIPASGAVPTSLVRARVTATPDCGIGPNPLDPEGHMVNPLLSEGILLSIKLRLDPAYGNTLLSEVGCNIHPVLYQYMTPFYTVTDLLTLTNLGLGNIIGPPHLPHLLNLLSCVNGTYQLCEPGQNAVMPFAGVLSTQAEGMLSPKLEVYPNPASTMLFVDLSPWQSATLSVQLIDARGGVLQTLPTNDQSLLELDLQDYPAGLYLIRLNDGGEMVETVRVVKR
jgi:hypothetical protein